MHCSNCGKELLGEIKFCRFCGNRVMSEHQVNTPLTGNESKNNIEMENNLSRQYKYICSSRNAGFSSDAKKIMCFFCILLCIYTVVFCVFRITNCHPLFVSDYIKEYVFPETSIEKDNLLVTENEEEIYEIGETIADEEGAETVIDESTDEKNVENASNTVAVKRMFESFLNGKDEMNYDDALFNGSIIICREQPSEDNNNASYIIGGRGFSFCDTDCIDVIGDTYVFYRKWEFGGAYYKIDIIDKKMFIYWSDSLDKQYELCGQIGETEETKSRDEAEKMAKEFFNGIQGSYINEGYVGTVTIRPTEGSGANSYASYSLEGTKFTVLYDTYCSAVINGNEYIFELYDECYRIVDGENITIYRGASMDDCNTVCAYLGEKIELAEIDTCSLAGRFVNEQNSNIEFNMNMYSDYVEIGGEVGSITIGYLSGLVYWQDTSYLGVGLNDGDHFDMKVYKRNGEIILEIIGDGLYSGTYKMIEHYVS